MPNTPPAGTDKTIVVFEDSLYMLSAADFGFDDPDILDDPDPDSTSPSSGTFQAVRIETLPNAGTLRLRDVDVTSAQLIDAADIGSLVFTPSTNANGTDYASFTFSVYDGFDFDPTPNTITIDVTAVNDMPAGTPTAVLAHGTEDVAYTVNKSALLSGFTDVDGDALSVANVIASTGTISENGNTYIITQAANFNGAVNLTFDVTDGKGGTLTGQTLTYTVDAVTDTVTPNPIVLENLKTGTPEDYWYNVGHSNQIEGFTTDFSVNVGQEIDFKINVNGTAAETLPYKIEIFRLGYYGGDGARLVATLNNPDGTVQPDALYDASRGLVDAGNWAVTDRWQVPADAVSGVYFARLQRLDANGAPIDGAANQIPFIVRNDGQEADIVLQTSDTTWQAYNAWFGNNGQVGANFYGDASGTISYPPVPDPGLGAQSRAYAVSYNRPFITRDGTGPASGPQDYLFGADYAAIYWLEENGYNVTYISGVDTDRLGTSWFEDANGNIIRKAYISVGHDEYWSDGQRANVEAARDAGVNLLFWSGNEVYWKTRYEDSIDGTSTDYRTLVSYKETWANGNQFAGPADYANIDPSDEWTGTWRDLRFVDSVDANGVHIAVGARPENSLSGQLFFADGASAGGALDVPAEYSGLRFWRGTAVANGDGTFDIAPGLLGYEWDVAADDQYRPAGLIKLSETTLNWPVILVDQGNRTQPGTATHNLTLYRDDSGALVFGSGTVFWSWGLSNEHDWSPYGGNIESPILQQFTVNLLADMGIQPGSLQSDLTPATASTDKTAATVTLNDLPTQIVAYQPVMITGTATDDDGNPATSDGVVALVEVSVDGGATWRPAQGGANGWSYLWVPTLAGSYAIKARAIDDSLNLPLPSSLPSKSIEIIPPATFSLFDAITTVAGQFGSESQPIELGVKFEAHQVGNITELKYYRAVADANDTDVREGWLWDSNGNILATVTFTSAPNDSGWQVATLPTPVAILPNETYTVSYRTNDNYISLSNFFDAPFTEPYGVLSSPTNNGVYNYGSTITYPTSTYKNTNYWVDVTFDPADPSTDQPPQFTSAAIFTVPENSSYVARIMASDPDGNALTYGIAGGADADLFSIGPNTGTLSFRAAPDFEAPADGDGDNVYDLIVSVSDGIVPPVTQAIAVTVADLVNDAALFGRTDTPASTITDDPTDYELGVKFTANQNGEITALRYYRGAADAGDTDVRTLHLWDGAGDSLGSVTITSNPGESGWQSANLTTPIVITANTTYIASYGTTQNYAFSPNFFAGDWTGSDGILTAPASGTVGGNGVYSLSPGTVPTSTYNASNYWVDVIFIHADNQPPQFTSSANFTVPENNTIVSLTATDPNGNALTYGIAGGADANLFSINPTNGTLSFKTVPDFEAPADADGDNVYDLIVSVSDGIAQAVTQPITVTVTDIVEDSPNNSVALFGPTDTPASTITDDPTDYELGVKFTANQNGEITALRYYRGAADAGDTDVRTLHLWDGAGNSLGSVTITSNPGESGWQSANLTTPIVITANTTYIASYGTTQNYAFSPNFFAGDWIGSDGILTAPASGTVGGNGVYSLSPGTVPTSTHNASNYWVDVTFIYPDNQPPQFTSSANFTVPENNTIVGGVTATDLNGNVLTYGIAGGSDANLFSINPTNGTLSFKTVPDFEAPADAGANNVYDLIVSVSDGIAQAVTQPITVTVTDALDPPLAANDSGFIGTVNATLPISASALLANDNDPNGLQLSIDSVGGAINGTVDYDPNTKTVSFVPTIDYTGTASFTYSIIDTGGATASATVSMFVYDPSATSLFSLTTTPSIVSVNDPNPVELGVKFDSSADGVITGIRFYKGPQNTGTHVADLWTATGGALLATATFTDETPEGWQQANFAESVPVTAGTTYVASYHTSGNYSADPNLFATALTNGDLTAPSSAESGGNGVYAYGSNSLMPTNSFNATSYGVDVIFKGQLAA